MTDGAWVVEYGSLETYHLAAAMEEWPLFEQVKDLYPNLEKEIRDALRSDKARKLCERGKSQQVLIIWVGYVRIG